MTTLVRAARSLTRSPGFTLVAIATLGLGIGANAAMFSVIDAVLLQPLPYAQPESRVMIWSRWHGFDKTWLSEAEVLDYRRLCGTLKQVAAWSSRQANLTGDGDPLRIGVAAVTPNTFSTLGAAPQVGRGFTEQEGREGAHAVAVIGHGLWQRRFGAEQRRFGAEQRRFGADPAVPGRTLVLDGTPHRVVGVMPRGFQLPTDFSEDAAVPTELWVPLVLDTADPARGSHGLYGAAELTAGASAAQAAAELAAVTANLTREGLYPAQMQFTATAVPVVEEILGEVRPALLLGFGAVGFLLLIACANVANLLLARAEGRQRELAVRAALGASRARLLSQLATESLLLALPSALLAVAIARAGLGFMMATLGTGLPRASDIGIDGAALGFTLLLALAATLLFGLAPALRSARLDLVDALKDGAHASAGTGRQRLRALLVVGQMSLSVTLLAGAGLMLRSLWALHELDLGFEPRGVLTLRLSLPATSYQQPEHVAGFYRQLLERVRALPQVRAAGLLRSLPLASQIGDWGLDVEGYQEPHAHQIHGDWQVASDGALAALGARLVRGREFTRADTAGGQQVGLVNETMARRYWPGAGPIGRRFRMGSAEPGPWVRVIGVVRDVRHNGMRAPIKEKFYRPAEQFHRSTGFPIRAMSLVVRSDRDPLLLAPALRALVGGLDPDLPVAAVRTMDEVVAASLATPRLAGRLLGTFAVLALALAAAGTYSVLAYLVSRRRQEIGIRMAIGADRGAVLRLVLARAAALAVSGALLGALAALALSRLMGSLLFQVAPHDPVTLAAGAAVLVTVAMLASFIPARRATLVDPISALRVD